MTRYNSIKNNFTKGELDPNFIGRVETDVYNQGCALLENMLPLPQGGITKRPGTFVLKEITNSTSIPSTTFQDFQVYPIQVAVSTSAVSGEIRLKTVLVCISLKASGTDELWIKFYDSDGTAITPQNNFYQRPQRSIPDGVAPSAAEIYADTNESFLDFSYAQSNNVVAFTHKSGRMCPFFVVFTPANTPTVIPVPYYPTTSRANLSIYFPIAFPLDSRFDANIVPYSEPNISSVTMTPSATAVGACTITCSQNTFYDTTGGTWDQWQGTMIALTSSGNTGFARVTSRSSNTVVNAEIIVPFTAGATTNWRISQWNGYYGFPRSVALHDQRFVWGGSPSFGDSIWSSEAGDIFHLRDFKAAQDASTDTSNLGYFGAVADTDAFTNNMSSNYKNDIKWLYSFNDLLAGTSQGVIKIGSSGQPYAYNTVNNSAQDGVGTGHCSPVQVNNALFYTDATNQKLLFLEKNENTGAYSTQDATALNYKIMSAYHADARGTQRSGYWISQMAYLDTYKSIFLRMHLSDVLVSFSYNPSAGVTAFARHQLSPAGYADVKSICVAPNRTAQPPTVGIPSMWMAVSRTVAGGGQYGFYLEQLSTPLLNDTHLYVEDGQSNYYVNDGYQVTFGQYKPSINYMDGMNTVSDAPGSFPTTSSVVIRGSGGGSRVYDSSTVSVFGSSPSTGTSLYYYGSLASNSSGVITTPIVHGFDNGGPVSNSDVFYGFDYNSKIKLLPVEAGSNFGTRQGSIQRTHEIVLRLYESRGFKIGKDFTTMVDYLASKFPTAAPNYDILTGDFRIAFTGNPDNDQMCLLHDIPFPFTLVAVILKGVAYD